MRFLGGGRSAAPPTQMNCSALLLAQKFVLVFPGEGSDPPVCEFAIAAG